MTSIVIVLGLTSLLGAGVALAGIGAAWRQRRLAEQRRTSLIDLELELQRLHRELSDVAQRAAFDSARLGQVQEEGSRTTRELTQARDAAEKELLRARAELADREQRLERRAQQIERERREHAGLQRQIAAAHRRLQAVGVAIDATPRRPLALAERGTSQSQLEDLLVTTASEATAIVDTRGFALLGAGEPSLTGRLGALVASLDDAAPAMAAWLCAPIDAWSSRGLRTAHHLLRLDDAGHWLGATTLGERPTFALHHARLRLTGQPPEAPAVPELPELVLDLDDAPDANLSERLEAWATQQALQAATLLSPDGRPLATTAAAQPSAATQLRRALGPWLERALRDDGVADGVALSAYDADGQVATFRMLGADTDACAVLTLGPRPVSDRALDDLAGLVRWHRQPTPSQQAS